MQAREKACTNGMQLDKDELCVRIISLYVYVCVYVRSSDV